MQTTRRHPETLFFQRITIGAGLKYPVVVSGNYLYVEGITFGTSNLSQFALTDASVTVKPDTINVQALLLSDKREIQFPERFNFLEFFNASSVTVFLHVWVGVGRIRCDDPRRIINSSCASLLTANSVAAYADGENVVPGPFALTSACSPYDQRGTLRAVSVQKSTATLTNANFSLWLFSSQGITSQPSHQPMVLPGTLSHFNFLGIVSLPSFVTGGTGSSSAYSFVAGLEIPLWYSPLDQNFSDGTIYACLVANAAYVPAAFEVFDVNTTIEWGG